MVSFRMNSGLEDGLRWSSFEQVRRVSFMARSGTQTILIIPSLPLGNEIQQNTINHIETYTCNIIPNEMKGKSNRPRAERRVTFQGEESPKRAAETVPNDGKHTANRNSSKRQGWKKQTKQIDEERAYMSESSMNSIFSERSNRRVTSDSCSSNDSKDSFNSYSSRQEPSYNTKSSPSKNRTNRQSSFQKLRTSFRKMITGSAPDNPCVHYLILAAVSMVIAVALVIGGAFVYDKVFKTDRDSASRSNDIVLFPSQAPSNTPNSSPQSSIPQNGACTDNRTFIFILLNGNAQPCRWFDHDQKSEQRKRRYCVNATINSNCCKSCEGIVFNETFPSSSPTNVPFQTLPPVVSYSPSSSRSNVPSGTPSQFLSSSPPTYLNTCIDNQTFLFNLLNGSEHPCSWFNQDMNSDESKDEYCRNETIKSNCCKSCEGIQYLDMAPSLSPSTTPSIVNGTR